MRAGNILKHLTVYNFRHQQEFVIKKKFSIECHNPISKKKQVSKIRMVIREHKKRIKKNNDIENPSAIQLVAHCDF